MAGILPFLAPKLTPSLTYANDEVTIVGSVRDMFRSSVFTGPNRAEKRARALPEVSPIVVANAFADIRKQLAADRSASETPIAPGLREFLKAKEAPQAALSVKVASIDPALMSAALDAIDKAAPDQPEPISAPRQLAYARANTPASIFDRPARLSVSDKQFQCLATAVYFEARGESYRGQAAVAQVVLNRVKHSLYPGTICSVVYQNQSRRNSCQFSFACDGIPERITEPDAWAKAKEIAQKVLEGEIYLPEVGNATHYHANYVRPRWASKMKKVTQIGLHIFYRFRSA